MFRTYLANSLLSKKFLQLNPTPWLITNTAMKRNIEPPRVRVRDEHLDPDKITFTVSCVSCLGDVTDGRTNERWITVLTGNTSGELLSSQHLDALK